MASPIAGLAVVGLGASLAAMDLAVNVAFPSITAAFALETRAIRWLVVCYVLTYASLMLVFGKLGDRIGHRRIFRAGLLLSIAAHTLCALAPSYGALLAARVVQGIATALVLSCAPALATFLFEESKRTRALGAYSSLAAIAGIVAPIVGGMSIAVLGWSGVFWFRVPVAVLATVLLPMLPEQPQSPHARGGYGAELAAQALLATGLALALLSFTLALAPGTQGYSALTAVAGFAVLAAFVLQQRRSPAPVFPRAVMRDRTFVLPNLASIALHLAVFAVPLLTPYYLERIAGHTPATSGAVLACSPAGILVGSMLAPALVRRTGARSAALAAGLLVVLCQFALGLWAGSPALVSLLVALAIHGLGIGVFAVAYTDIVVAALPRSDRGLAGSLTMLTRTIGVVAGAVALMAALSTMETRAIAAGLSATVAFRQAYENVFQGSALLLAVVLPLCFFSAPSRVRNPNG